MLNKYGQILHNFGYIHDNIMVSGHHLIKIAWLEMSNNQFVSPCEHIWNLCQQFWNILFLFVRWYNLKSCEDTYCLSIYSILDW